MQCALFMYLVKYDLVGINKHFSMAVVSEKLCSQFGPDICSDVIWSKLRTMFDLTAVDDREEVIPFTLEEKEFSLPRRDFNNLITEKQNQINKVCFALYFCYPRPLMSINFKHFRTNPPGKAQKLLQELLRI